MRKPTKVPSSPQRKQGKNRPKSAVSAAPSKSTYRGSLGKLADVSIRPPLRTQRVKINQRSPVTTRSTTSDKTITDSRIGKNFFLFEPTTKKPFREPESLLRVFVPPVMHAIRPEASTKSYNKVPLQRYEDSNLVLKDRFTQVHDMKHSGSLGQSYTSSSDYTPPGGKSEISSLFGQRSSASIMLGPSSRKMFPVRRFATTPQQQQQEGGGMMGKDKEGEVGRTNRLDDDYDSTIVLDEEFMYKVTSSPASVDRGQTSGRQQQQQQQQKQQQTSSKQKQPRHESSKHKKLVDEPEKPLSQSDLKTIKTIESDPTSEPLRLDERIGRTALTNIDVPREHRAHHFIEYSALTVIPKTDNRANTDSEKVFPQHAQLAGTSNMNRLASMYGKGVLNQRLFDPKEADRYYTNKKKEEKQLEKHDRRVKRKASLSGSDTSRSHLNMDELGGKRSISMNTTGYSDTIEHNKQHRPLSLSLLQPSRHLAQSNSSPFAPIFQSVRRFVSKRAGQDRSNIDDDDGNALNKTEMKSMNNLDNRENQRTNQADSSSGNLRGGSSSTTSRSSEQQQSSQSSMDSTSSSSQQSLARRGFDQHGTGRSTDGNQSSQEGSLTHSVEYGYTGFDPDQLVPAEGEGSYASSMTRQGSSSGRSKPSTQSQQQSTGKASRSYQAQTSSIDLSYVPSASSSSSSPQSGSDESDNPNRSRGVIPRNEKPRYKPKVQGNEWD